MQINYLGYPEQLLKGKAKAGGCPTFSERFQKTGFGYPSTTVL